MDNYNSSFNNYFTSALFNRSSEMRTDEEWLKSKLKDPETFFIPLKGLKMLISKEDPLQSVFFKYKEIKSFLNNQSIPVLLGESRGRYYFCVDFSGNAEADDLFTSRGEFKELRSVAPLIDKEDAALLAYSRAMVYWHSMHLYCGVCGAPTEVKDAGHKRICANSECSTIQFPRTDPAIIVLVSHGDECLLARQPHWREGQYATIAGFVEPGESLEQAVAREVYEETGIHIDKAWYFSSQPWPFPAAVMLGFTATAGDTDIVLRDGELEDARWFSRNEITTLLKKGELKLPTPFSISFRLVENWFNSFGEISLKDLLAELKIE